MSKYNIKFKKSGKIILIAIFISVFICPDIFAKTFKIVSYNVQNLFDLHKNKTEYREYVPDTKFGWTKKTAAIKYLNITRVLKDINADIISLQEIESVEALLYLRTVLKSKGIVYPYFAIADLKPTTVKCALLSKFPIVKKKEVVVSGSLSRNILRTDIDISGNNLIVYVNHWKSKKGPESLRKKYANALKKEIDQLETDADFVLTGDFNSNYNEYITFVNNVKLNDTNKRTGINHILMTIKNNKLVDERLLVKQRSNKYLYNLWLEIPYKYRWSYNFFGRKSTPDHIILSKGLYDNKGVSYKDNSFNKFTPHYLFKNRGVFNWKRAKRGRGKHLGMGFSDHLPIFALFTTTPFVLKTK